MKLIKNKLILALGISSLAATAAFADESMTDTNQMPMTPTPQQFVSDAAVGGMKEIYLSERALDVSTNADVKDLARHMVKDHRAANKKLEKIATSEGLTFPATNTFSADDPTWSNPQLANPENIKGAQLLTLTNLPYRSDYLAVQSAKSLVGSEFDQAYVRDMVADHAAAVSEFEAAAQNLTDIKLKKFATRTLPTLRYHAQMAKGLCGTNYVGEMMVTNPLPKKPYIAPIP
jgi:putative membrane protein